MAKRKQAADAAAEIFEETFVTEQPPEVPSEFIESAVVSTNETPIEVGDATSIANDVIPQATASKLQTAAATQRTPGRPWTERYVQPVKYRHFTFTNPLGKSLIAFKFDLLAGETKPDEELLSVLHNHKYFKEGKPNGLAENAANDPESIRTGFHYQDFGPGIGKLWVAPNNELGRKVAFSLNEALSELAVLKQQGPAPSF